VSLCFLLAKIKVELFSRSVSSYGF
ncbi:uncharacterized protein METZ01_LOCUS329697, partial [marine metagenome]